MSDKLVVCSHCGSVNRLPEARSALAAKCGKCGRKLFVAHPQDVDSVTLRRHLERTTLPVLVDVWAPWCGPCRAMAPAFEAAARELEPELVLTKLDSDNEPALGGVRHPEYTDYAPVPWWQGDRACIRGVVGRTDRSMGPRTSAPLRVIVSWMRC